MPGRAVDAPTCPGRVGALDGLRGLAVGAVLLYHSQFGFARGGYLGVSLFFTLSGFLITCLLVTERRVQSRVPLRSFWARRARRLLPAAALALAGVLIYGATVASADQLRSLRGDMLATLGYVGNWRFYFSGQNYAQLFSAPSPVLHFWSLAIEEQFYVVFPLVVALVAWASRGRRYVLAALLGAGIVISVLAGRALYASAGSTRVYYGTDTRAAELLIGALLAVVVSGRVTPGRAMSTRIRLLAAVAGVGALGAMMWWWATVEQTAPWLYRGGLALHACCAAIVIAAARVDGPFARVLAWRPLAALGLISYGVYLFHWPVFLWLTPDRTGLAATPLLALRLLVTLTVAIGSFLFVERPILHGTRLRGAYPRLVIPAAATALVATLVLITSSLPQPSIVFASLSSQPSALRSALQSALRVSPKPKTPPPLPSARPRAVPLHRAFSEHRPLRIMIVGDSVGRSLGRGFELWAYETGGATVRNLGTPSCGMGRHLPVRTVFGATTVQSDACGGWDKRWPETISSFDPDVVVVLYTIWEIQWRQLPGGRWGRPGDPDFDRWHLSEYEAAADILSARGATVLWLDTPCVHTAISPNDLFSKIDYGTIPELAAARPAVHMVDMNRLLCPKGPPNPDFGGVTDARPDGAHYSDAGALAVVHWFMPIILGDQPAPPWIFRRRTETSAINLVSQRGRGESATPRR
jgi:peptidoglycan/LPS O-acetylase OafA/YrhL